MISVAPRAGVVKSNSSATVQFPALERSRSNIMKRAAGIAAAFAVALALTSIVTGLLLMGKASAAPPTPPGTNLLFPYVVTNFGEDTALVISNTSADPFNTVPQPGTCTLRFYSNGATPSTFTTGNIAPGTTFTRLASSIQANVGAGYIIASCTFSYAHGLAFIVNPTLSPNASIASYLAIVIETPRPNGENLNN
jgi:hypothetical protein